MKKASSFKFVTPALGVEVRGVDLRKLSDGEKDDLSVHFLACFGLRSTRTSRR